MSNKKDKPQPQGFVSHLIWFFLDNPIITVLFLLALIFAGLFVIPFDVPPIESYIDRGPVPVDAIPNIGENQQIVFTEWPGRSPHDVEDQVTYPLSVAFQGIPGVKSIRSYSMFGFSSIYIIFEDGIDFYWSRSRVLEKMATVKGEVPEGVTPVLGPDATALGQIYWYTLEAEGFSLEELRSIQDWYVRYALQSTPGVSEVASVGGYVREYQIDVDPEAMWEYKIKLQEVFKAIRRANIDVGAKTIERNGVEYVIRGVGFIKKVQDIENVVIKEVDNVPIFVKNIARVKLGPAMRRGVLDKEGAEVVGGVVTVRYGENPMEVIERVKKKIEQISPGLPSKKLKDGTTSQVEIVPFYDRTNLINETLATLKDALIDETLITIIIILLFLLHFRSSMVVSLSLPLGVLVAFILMKIFGVTSNIMSLSGIAIAIGTMVDMGVIMTENIVRHLEESPPDRHRIIVVYEAAAEVGSAILTAIATTIISFLPIFFMEGPEGKLFKPLAYTKTFALFGSVMIAILLNPLFCYWLFASKKKRHHWMERAKWAFQGLLILGGFYLHFWIGLVMVIFVAIRVLEKTLPPAWKEWGGWGLTALATLLILYWMTLRVMPLGRASAIWKNFILIGLTIGGVIGFFRLFIRYYSRILTTLLEYKKTFLLCPSFVLLMGLMIWLGFDTIFGTAAKEIGLGQVRSVSAWQWMDEAFPGMGEEFMPDLDEGSFLYMPTTMPHASIGEALEIMQKQDIAFKKIPEVKRVVGKLGRVDSPLDPAPVSMLETMIFYKDKYKYVDGKWVRQWRDHIETKDDLWKEIVEAGKFPGATSAPKLQPISTRIVMLQTGMRAPMGVKVKGKDLREIEKVGLQIEKFLKKVPGVEPASVNADRIIAKPYIEFHIDRERIARYGVNIRDVQDIIEIAIGGKKTTTTVEGRERYPVRVRYKRELRDNLQNMKRILVPTRRGTQIPLSELTDIKMVNGPQMIKSEDTFLVGYVIFDKTGEFSEVEVVEKAQAYLKEKIEAGEFDLPKNTSYEFAGNYQNQIRAEKRLRILVPASILIIFLFIYLQFRSVSMTLVIFTAIPVALSGGFIILWLYGKPWFMNFDIFGTSVRDMFHMQSYNLSVAVWVGFIAMFGVATDDGVVMGTYLDQSFDEVQPSSIEEIRQATVIAGEKRIRPCLMTSATTILALIPVLMSTGKGADVMIPMALPTVGGLSVVLITLFVVPVCYCGIRELFFEISQTTELVEEKKEEIEEDTKEE